MEKERRALIEKIDSRLRKRRGHYFPIVVVCGAGRPEPDEKDREPRVSPHQMRRYLVEKLIEAGFIAMMFEDDLSLVVPSIEELEVCRFPEIDKVVAFSHSPAAISEYTSFLEDPVVSKKLVVLVPEVYHPFTNPTPGYLDSVFWRVLVEGGQVLPYDSSGHTPVWEGVGKYFEAYRVIRGSQVNQDTNSN